MDNFLATLAFGFVSALAFIAYRHPVRYSKAFPWLVGTNLAVFFVALAWDTALGEALQRLNSVGVDSSQAQEAIAKIRINMLLASVIVFSLLFYLIILAALPGILELDKEQRTQKSGAKK